MSERIIERLINILGFIENQTDWDNVFDALRIVEYQSGALLNYPMYATRIKIKFNL